MKAETKTFQHTLSELSKTHIYLIRGCAVLADVAHGAS